MVVSLAAVPVFKFILGWKIFYPESIALVAFAISWLTKGRADWTWYSFRQRTRLSRLPKGPFKDIWKSLAN